MKRHNLVFLIVLVLCIQHGSAFGYLDSGSKQVVSPGDEVHFKTYLFGANESVKVMKVDAPRNWRVNVNPEIVNFPVEREFRYMQADNGYRKIVPVRIGVSIPQNQQSGDYKVTLFFTSSSPEGHTGASVSVRQVQDIRFAVRVMGENSETAEQTDVREDVQEPTHEEKRNSGGMMISLPEPKDTGSETPTGELTEPLWKNPVFVLLLFEITWGIALVYALKRKDMF